MESADSRAAVLVPERAPVHSKHRDRAADTHLAEALNANSANADNRHFTQSHLDLLKWFFTLYSNASVIVRLAFRNSAKPDSAVWIKSLC
ncbi:hypothetical protein [Caballeronia sp. ATUFL_M2_KS44]|uniref:hypothetical protein n=1 Tax=Caballeronia sp. ATUFL_M2_KS44 TaxID=2921767 RepID=UPI002028163E|nr:hypothetical protein [Caballeronia sp. ATUFL_M2_KS44]